MPVTIPDIPENRAEVVPARLARKIAPLFGIPTAHSPYPVTWVSDYTSLSISEIARGAPSPSRTPTADDAGGPDPGGWKLAERAVVTHRRPAAARPEPLPNEIANATINRFGPDTKAAVVLTAANKLLEPVTEAIKEALDHLWSAPDGPLPLELRLGAWAGLVLEAFRSQPALVSAALKARSIQRTHQFGAAFPHHGADQTAPSERPAARSPGSASRPTELHLLDSTLHPLLYGRADPPEQAAGRRPPAAFESEPLTRRLIGYAVQELAGRLSALGTPSGDGYLWVVDDGGHRRVEAFVPHYPFITAFVRDMRQWVRCHDANARSGNASASERGELPYLPSAKDLELLDLLPRRAILSVLCTLIRLGVSSGNTDIKDAERLLAALARLDRLTDAALPDKDPAAAMIRCHLADLRMEIVRQNTGRGHLMAAAVNGLVGSLEAAERLCGQAVLGRSDVADLLFSGNVELLAAVRLPDYKQPGLPGVDELTAWLHAAWDRALGLLGVEPAAWLDPAFEASEPDREQQLGVGFHLQNYATFIASRGDQAGIDRGLRLFSDVVVPQREAYFQRTGWPDDLLFALQNAAIAYARSADAAIQSGELDRARQLAGQGRDLIGRSISTGLVGDLLERSGFQPDNAVCRYVLLAVPALLTGLELGISPDVPFDRDWCDRLIALAKEYSRWAEQEGNGFARAAEVNQLAARYELWRANRTDGGASCG